MAGVRAGLLPDEVGERYTDRVGDADEGVEHRGRVALLDAVVRGPVHLDALSNLLLGEVGAGARGPDAVPNGLAAGDYPVGRGNGARHTSTLIRS